MGVVIAHGVENAVGGEPAGTIRNQAGHFKAGMYSTFTTTP